MNKIKNILNEYASELGFCKIGFAKAEIPVEALGRYEKWIAMGYQADMKYITDSFAKRKNPNLILSGVKTVIMLAISYKTPFERPEEFDSEKFGKISRYAWGGDYHDIIGKKLKLFIQKINELKPGSENKGFVDTGPVLEKYWAERSGIGWQGKNSLIITKEYGSFIFLGTVLTTLEFEPDEPAKNLCGKCELCLKECPTAALEAPGLLNPVKCLSYWTVEARGNTSIPEEIASNSKGWVYGCDICQDVCPWNISAPNIGGEEFFPHNGETLINYQEIMNMSEADFREKFKKRPLKRLKLDGIKRNIKCIARIERI